MASSVPATVADMNALHIMLANLTQEIRDSRSSSITSASVPASMASSMPMAPISAYVSPSLVAQSTIQPLDLQLRLNQLRVFQANLERREKLQREFDLQQERARREMEVASELNRRLQQQDSYGQEALNILAGKML
jgi:hypothetical protein